MAVAGVVWAALALQVPAADSVAIARTRSALAALRDSLSTVRGASAQYRADLPRASAVLVLQRSERMRRQCAGALAAADTLTIVLAGPPPRASVTAQRDRARSALAELRPALRRCVAQHDTTAGIAAADSLRAWGPYRHRVLLEAVRWYELVAVEYWAALPSQ